MAEMACPAISTPAPNVASYEICPMHPSFISAALTKYPEKKKKATCNLGEEEKGCILAYNFKLQSTVGKPRQGLQASGHITVTVTVKSRDK